MSISVVDSLDKAIKVASDVRYVRHRWGKNGLSFFGAHQIADAMVILLDAYEATGELAATKVTAESAASAAVEELIEVRAQLTKANRQLAAANARAARVAKGKNEDQVPNNEA